MDFYSLLGVDRQADLGKIKTAFRTLAFKHHPDKNLNSESTVLFQRIAKAYEILIDPKSRKAYDAYLDHINSSRLLVKKPTQSSFNFNHGNEKSTTSSTNDAYQFSKFHKALDENYIVVRLKSFKNIKLDEIEIRKCVKCTISKIYFNANMTTADVIIYKDEKLQYLPNYNENFTLEICQKSKKEEELNYELSFNSYEKNTLHRMRNICS